MTVTDEAFVAVLSRFASMANLVLRNPERWLGWGSTTTSESNGRVATLRQRVFSETPGSEHWRHLTAEDRSEWWVSRISNLAGFLAATPRVMGAVSDRVPLQAALGSAVAGLAVCAVALEHGVDDPRDWVPLLGVVLFERDLRRELPACQLQSHHEISVELSRLDDNKPPQEDLDVSPDSHRAGSTALQLARGLLTLRPVFEQRPRGARVFRAMGKVPVVGLVGGWLDERGGVRKAAEATRRALSDA